MPLKLYNNRDAIIEGTKNTVVNLLDGITGEPYGIPQGLGGNVFQLFYRPIEVAKGVEGTVEMYKSFPDASPTEKVEIVENTFIAGAALYFGWKGFAKDLDKIKVPYRPSSSKINVSGISQVKAHLSQFDNQAKIGYWKHNKMMIERLEKLSKVLWELLKMT